eukprot:g7857.t1
MSCFKANTFDFVLDKGTLDAIVCQEGYQVATPTFLQEVFRVLKLGGSYVLISHGDPSTRLLYLCNLELSWEVNCYWSRTNGTSFHKGPFSASDKDKMKELCCLREAVFIYKCSKTEK